MNRLKLDFSINDAQERAQFVSDYLLTPQFSNAPPTASELETISNYLLWGQDVDGTSPVSRNEIEIDTRNKTWRRPDIESLDALLENPAFSEIQFRRPTEATPKSSRQTFNREKALKQCPPALVSVLQDLFTRIDWLELQIHLYEYQHQKRKKPPRADLVNKFTPEQIETAKTCIQSWTQYHYLKQRHLIVELRREQFTIRDSYIDQHQSKSFEPEPELVHQHFNAEIPVFPLGIINTRIGKLVFEHNYELTEEDLAAVSKFYWNKQSSKRPSLYFDFEDENHVAALLSQLGDLDGLIDEQDPDNSLSGLIETLKFYIRLADLNEIQQAVLDMKVKHLQNIEIAQQLNKRFGKQYTSNYVSTIYHKKAIANIVEAVKYHKRVVENLMFKENFKKCSTCGRLLLIDPVNFVRKSRARDGFSARCKKCDKLARQKKKELRNDSKEEKTI